MKEITITPTKHDISASCCVCDARNYDPQGPGPHIGHRVEQIYVVKMGPMTPHLCAECMTLLSNELAKTRIRIEISRLQKEATE